MSYKLLLKHNFFDRIKKNCTKIIKKDRDHYNRVWETIEAYCRDNVVVVSNVKKIIDKPDELDRVYSIYCYNPLVHANNITNEIYEKNADDPERRFTEMKTNKEQEEFVIKYDFRDVAMIYKIQQPKGRDIIECIHPLKIDKILFMPFEIEIIDVYGKLYNIAQFGQKKDNLKLESRLFDRIIQDKRITGGFDVRKRMTEFRPINGGNYLIAGGNDGGKELSDGELSDDEKDDTKSETSETSNTSDTSGYSPIRCKDKKKNLIESIKISIVKDWLKGRPDIILIGSWADHWLRHHDKLCVDTEKIQIMSTMSPDEFMQKISAYVNRINKFAITMRQQELHIPKDFRTKRFTFYMKIESEHGITEKPFLDLFNSLSFEVIPCKQFFGINIADKYTILRFLFIDLWVIKIISSMELFTKDVLAKKQAYLWKLIISFRSATYECDDYKGIFHDYDLHKKMSTLSNKMFYPYHPEIYKKINNKLREILPHTNNWHNNKNKPWHNNRNFKNKNH